MRSARSVAGIVVSIVLASCTLGDGPPSGYTQVTFVLPETVVPSASSITPVSANEIVFLDVSATDRWLQHLPVSSGLNTILLPKNGLYLLGFVYNPAIDTSPNSMSLAGAISIIGNIAVISAGLDSLPISDEASSEISLGDLNYAETVFGSGISEEEVASATGHSEEALIGYGEFDNMTLKLMNPDVDQNGIYDVEESFEWDFTLLTQVDFRPEDFDFESASYLMSIEHLESVMTPPTYVFWFDEHLEFVPIEYVYLILPDGSQIQASYGNIEPTSIRQYYFHPSRDFLPGDYEIKIGEAELLLSNVQFVRPDNHLKGFTFPLVHAERNDEGQILNLSWKWLKIDNGSVVASSPEENEMKLSIFYFYGESPPGTDWFAFIPERLGQASYENGTIDVAFLGLRLTERIDCDYWDKGSNDYKFVFHQ